MLKNKVDLRMRLARQGLFSCLPMPYSTDILEGSTDGEFSDKEQIEGCIKLWRTVIDRALLYTLSPNKESSEEALRWFDLNNKESQKYFKTVCDLAFLDSDWVSEKAKELYEKYKDERYCYYPK
jgi:hypothetical protein